MSDMTTEHPPQGHSNDDRLREAREALTAHGVLIRREFWEATLHWFNASCNVLRVPPDIVCAKYLNLVRDSIHELFRR